jgi:hypothetical protein
MGCPVSMFPTLSHMWAFAVCGIFELQLSGYMLPGASTSCILRRVSIANLLLPFRTYHSAELTKDLHIHHHDIVSTERDILCVFPVTAFFRISF